MNKIRTKTLVVGGLFCLLLLFSQTAQAQLPACTEAIADTDNDGVAAANDVDKDGDGLIEVCDLEGLNEIRFQLDGRGYRTTASAALMTTGCPRLNQTTTTKVCIGYELTRHLDFNTTSSYRDMANTRTWVTGTGWPRIGKVSGNGFGRGPDADGGNVGPFNAIFKGNGYTISNLFINRPGVLDLAGIGFFGTVENNTTDTGAIIDDVGLISVDVRGPLRIGGLVGQLFNNSKITNSFVIGTIALVDYDESHSAIGGLVGWQQGNSNIQAEIRNSYTFVRVSPTPRGKGALGTGGLVGQLDRHALISDSYARGSVRGATRTGGLAGYNQTTTLIQNSYAVVDIGNPGFLRKAIAVNTGGITTNTYWNTDVVGVSNQEDGGRTTAMLKSSTVTMTTYKDWSPENWDFGDSNQYPALKYNHVLCAEPSPPAWLRCGDRQGHKLAAQYLASVELEIEINFGEQTSKTVASEESAFLAPTNDLQWVVLEETTMVQLTITPTGYSTPTLRITSSASGFDEQFASALGVSKTLDVPISTGNNVKIRIEVKHNGAVVASSIITFDSYSFSDLKLTATDVDIDDDGYIEIDTPQKLNAIRFQPDGSGFRETADALRYSKGCAEENGNRGVCIGYELVADIDLSMFSNWQPINGFSGGFRGNGHTISNLKINRATDDNVGLFSNIEGAVIDSVSLVGANVRGKDRVGGLVGSNNGGRVLNSHVGSTASITASVIGEDQVGGLVGRSALGGSTPHIVNSYTDVTVKGDENVGGLVGENYGKIFNSYALGDVVGSTINDNSLGSDGIGGLVGASLSQHSEIKNTYAVGFVSLEKGTSSTVAAVGGLVGLLNGATSGAARISNSYALSAAAINFSSGGHSGGLVGYSNRADDASRMIKISNSYWNTETTGHPATSSYGVDLGDVATHYRGFNTAQLTTPEAPGATSNDPYFEWKTDDWNFANVFPTLKYGVGPDANNSACEIDSVCGNLLAGQLSDTPPQIANFSNELILSDDGTTKTVNFRVLDTNPNSQLKVLLTAEDDSIRIAHPRKFFSPGAPAEFDLSAAKRDEPVTIKNVVARVTNANGRVSAVANIRVTIHSNTARIDRVRVRLKLFLEGALQ